MKKLPPMKRKTAEKKVAKVKQQAGMATLYALPRMKRKKGGWGKVDVARWFEVDRGKGNRESGTHVGGVCAKCGETFPAGELILEVIPFRKPWEPLDRWVCDTCKF
jgi:hypothetical protein